MRYGFRETYQEPRPRFLLWVVLVLILLAAAYMDATVLDNPAQPLPAEANQ